VEGIFPISSPLGLGFRNRDSGGKAGVEGVCISLSFWGCSRTAIVVRACVRACTCVHVHVSGEGRERGGGERENMNYKSKQAGNI